MTAAEQVHGLPPPGGPEPKLPPTTIAALAGLLMAALCFLVVGLGFAFGLFGDGDAPAEEGAEDQAIAADAHESTETGAEPEPGFAGIEAVPTASVDPAPATQPAAVHDGAVAVPVATGGADGGSASSGAGGGGSGSSRAGSVGPATRGGGPRVTVTLVPVHYDHVEARIGGSVFRLDKTKTVKIRPGSFQVELRKSADAPWKPAGRLNIELGTKYRVKLFDPPLTMVEVLQ